MARMESATDMENDSVSSQCPVGKEAECEYMSLTMGQDLPPCAYCSVCPLIEATSVLGRKPPQIPPGNSETAKPGD